jgi:uncharacterized protein YndB with AHSA1/START domain
MTSNQIAKSTFTSSLNNSIESSTMKNTGTLKVTTPSDTEVQMIRVFNAPKQMVYDAFSKPELLKRWFGPRGWSLETCEVDHRVGGGFRFMMAGPEGAKLGMRGRYIELNPPNGSVHAESFDDYPGESIVTSTFVEANGKTTLTPPAWNTAPPKATTASPNFCQRFSI